MADWNNPMIELFAGSWGQPRQLPCHRAMATDAAGWRGVSAGGGRAIADAFAAWSPARMAAGR
jgi:hypothetical protein